MKMNLFTITLLIAYHCCEGTVNLKDGTKITFDEIVDHNEGFDGANYLVTKHRVILADEIDSITK